MRNIEAVIFDMDGILFDTERLCRDVWQQIGRRRGYEIRDSDYQLCIGRTERDTHKIIMDRFGSSFPYDEFRTEARSELRQIMERDGPPQKPGLHSILTLLKNKGVKTALATSTSRESASAMIKRAGIDHYFNALAFGTDVQNGKPAPDIFLLAASLLKTDVKHCVVIEDSPAGLQAAAAAGIRSIFIKDLVDPAPEIAAGAAYSCVSLAEAGLIIDQLTSSASA